LLPEDLRSSIVKNYGRRQIKEYTDDLLIAVTFWRQIGAWGSKLRATVYPAAAPEAPAVPTTSKERNVIALAERRRPYPVQTEPYSDDDSEYELIRPMTAFR
jgi:hypothetical protein